MIKTVKVSDIAEYPTSFGSPGCALLDSVGISFYTHTPEEVLYHIESGAKSAEKLAICKSSHCGNLLKVFQQGETPGGTTDPITLSKYNGKYWVGEGKHRVCVAKRFGIQEIQAQVTHLDEDIYSALPCIGVPDTYSAIGTWYERNFRRKGQFLYLWVFKPDHYCRGLHTVYNLNYLYSDEDELVKVCDGLFIRQRLLGMRFDFIKRILLGCPKTVHSEVIIKPNHALTKIWLLKITYDNKGSSKHIEHLYRFGLWQKHHENQLRDMIT